MNKKLCIESIKKKVFLTILIVTLVTLSCLSGCVSKTSETDKQANSYVTIGILEDIYGFFPWIETYDVTTISINSNIFNSLVELDKNMRLTPSLAETWSNPNNLTWRFKLREDVTFHNGDNLTAEDVKYTIDSILDDDQHCLKGLLTSVDRVEIVNNYTVDIITKKPYPVLLNNLVDIFIASKDYQQNATEQWPIGTGAYKLTEYNEEESIRLERFENYWKYKPDLQFVEFKIFEKSEDKKNALMNKTIDFSGVHPDFYDEVTNAEGFDIKTTVIPLVFYLGYDVRVNESNGFENGANPLSNVHVRKAMYHAIDINTIIDEHLNGFAEPVSQFVSPLIYGYNPNIDRLEYDIETAQQYMNESGYSDGFSITLDCSDDNTTKEMISAIADQLSQININVTVNPLSGGAFYGKVISGNSSFYAIGWIAATGDGGEIFDYLIRTYNEETGVGLYNCGRYSNSEVDEIGEQVAELMNLEERLQLMQEGFRIAMEDVPIIPLYVSTAIYCFDEDLDWSPRGDLNLKVEEIHLE